MKKSCGIYGYHQSNHGNHYERTKRRKEKGKNTLFKEIMAKNFKFEEESRYLVIGILKDS